MAVGHLQYPVKIAVQDLNIVIVQIAANGFDGGSIDDIGIFVTTKRHIELSGTVDPVKAIVAGFIQIDNARSPFDIG